MLICVSASGSEHTVRRRRVADGVEHSVPSQVMVEITSSHAVETCHPAFAPTVVGVDVLDMKRGTSHADAPGEIDRLMRDAAIMGIALINRCAIGTQHGLSL